MNASDDGWKRLEEIFGTAVAMPEKERAAYLDAACGDDEELRGEVEALLSADARGTRFGEAMDAAIAEMGHEVASADPAPEVSLAGRRIGAYEVTGLLGRGGMGAVYSAVRADHEYRKDVAIKLVRLGVDDPEIRRRFRAERQILANLDHPNIARLLDGGTTRDGLPYVVMERVYGERIDAYCDRHRLSVDDRLRLFRRVCDAVQFAHRSLVVHRDIKPGNILVAPDGVPKLLDFGIAKLLDPSETTGVTTRTSARMMTPEYASPEQVTGRPITTASDVYSLGVVLYELLTGRRPYPGVGPAPRELERAITEEEPEPPSAAATRSPGVGGSSSDDATGPTAEAAAEVRRTTPERLRRRLEGDLDDIVLMALRKETGRRYASVEALSEDLRRHLEGLPVRARPDTVAYRTAKFVRRHRAGVLGTVAGLVVVAGLTGFYTSRLALERDRARAETERVEQVVGFLTGLFEGADPYETRGRELTAGELLDAGAERIERELGEQPALRATMSGVIGGVYESLGLYREAAPFLENALELRRADRGADPLERAAAIHDLGDLAREMGAYPRADSLLGEALTTRRRVLGPSHPDVVRTLRSLGTSAFDQSLYGRSDSLFREAVDISRRLRFDAANVELLTGALVALGRSRSRQGEHEEAEALLREALERTRDVLGEDHPAVGNQLDALAETLRLQGRTEEAVAMFRDAVSHGERIFGSDHPTVVGRLGNLAVALTDLDREEEAIAIKRRVLAHNREVYGSRHPTVAAALNNLAASYTGVGDLERAEALYLESLEIKREHFGEVSSDVATTLNNLAHVAAERRDYRAALDYQRRALRIDREALAVDHPYVGQDLVLIGIFLLGDGQVDAAGTPLRSGTDILREALGEDHPALAVGLHSLGDYLVAAGELDDAEETVQEVLRIRRAVLEEGHWEIALSETLLGEVLAARGRYAEAEPLLVDGYEVVRGARPEGSRHRAEARQRLVRYWEARGRPERAAAVPP